MKTEHPMQVGRLILEVTICTWLNPFAPRKAKIECNFGLFECNRIKVPFHVM